MLKHFGTVARMGMPGSTDRLARCQRGDAFDKPLAAASRDFLTLPDNLERYRTRGGFRRVDCLKDGCSTSRVWRR